MIEITRVGIIGISEGNGHPFSFSAIINGYSDEGLGGSGWNVIYDYVRRRDPSEFGIEGLRVTHAWTQEKETTKQLCDACLIPNPASDWKDLIGEVDAVILARDDYENHFKMALPFLEAGIPVAVDKPLSLDIEELKAFKPYLESGRLFSCSGMRYARELDEPRAGLADYGKIKLIRGAVLNGWEKYGVHLLYAILALRETRPLAVHSLMAGHPSIAIHMEDGSLVQIDCLEDCPKTFAIDIWGTKHRSSHEILDNFTMFRRMLWHFARSVKSGEPAIPVSENLDVLRTLIAGIRAMGEGRKVFLSEIQI